MKQEKETTSYTCHCGKTFKDILDFQNHEKMKHTKKTGKIPIKNKDSKNEGLSKVQDNLETQTEPKRLDSQILKYRPKEAPLIQEEQDKDPTSFVQPSMDTQVEIQDDTKYYVCGCNHKIYKNKDELKYHINRQHMSFPPDGTLFGVCKQLVWDQFKPPIQVPAFTQEKTPVGSKVFYRFVCGCGSKFGTFKALDFHITKRHKGIEPQGTIGGHKTDPLKAEGDLENSSRQDKSISQIQSIQSKLATCIACQVQCTSSYLKCKECPDWRVCGECSLGNTSKQTHIAKKHTIYRFP